MDDDDETIQLATANKEIHRLRSVVEELNQKIEELKISQSRTPSTQGSSTRSQPLSLSKGEIDSPRSKSLFDVGAASGQPSAGGTVLGGAIVGTPLGSPAYVNNLGLHVEHHPHLSPNTAYQPAPDTSYFQPVAQKSPRTARYLSYPTPPPAAALDLYPHFLEHTPTTPYSFAIQQQLPPTSLAIPSCPPVPNFDAPETFPLRHHSQPEMLASYEYPMPTQPDPVSYKYSSHANSLPQPLPQSFPTSFIANRFSSAPSFPHHSIFPLPQHPLHHYEAAQALDRLAEPPTEKKRRPLSLTTFNSVPKLRRTLSDSYLVSPLSPFPASPPYVGKEETSSSREASENA